MDLQENGKPEKKKSHISSWLLMFAGIFVFAILLRVFIGQPCYIPSSSMENTLLTGDYVWLNKLTYGARLPGRFADIPLLNIFTWIKPLREADQKNDWGYHRVSGFKSPALHDVAVFTPEAMPGVLVVKRISGLPGDTVSLVSGRLHVNGRLIPEPKGVLRTRHDEPVEFPKGTTWTSHNYGPVVVPKAGMHLTLTPENYAWIQPMALAEGNYLSQSDSSFLCNGYTVSAYTFGRNYYFMLGDNRRNSLDSRYTGFIPESSLEGTIGFVLFSNDTSSPLGIAFRTKRLFKTVK